MPDVDVLIVAPVASKLTGNHTTVARWVALLSRPAEDQLSLRIQVQDCGECAAFAPAAPGVARIVFLLHAYRAGACWLRHRPPGLGDILIVVFGGTDINEPPIAEDADEVMARVLNEAHRCVCFNDALKDAAVRRFADSVPTLGGKCVVIPQAVDEVTRCPPAATDGLLEQVQMCSEGRKDVLARLLQSDVQRLRLCVWAGGFRSVKHPMAAVRWVRRAQEILGPAVTICLLFVGPVVERDVFDEVVACIRSDERTTTLLWRDGVEREQLLNAIYADPRVAAVLNSSRSEGQPQSVMEAMARGRLAVVSDVPGNAAVVSDAVGVLINEADPEPGIQRFARLLASPQAAAEVAQAGQALMATTFSTAAEASMYRRLMREAIAPQ